MPSNKRRPKDDEVSVTSEGNKPLKNVPALMGEGEKFFRDKLYDKAIQCYSEALDMSPENKNALVERSSCYLKIGRNDLALADAEESLKDNKEFTKGLYQKAEALYAMGEFEMALVFYHRGKKIRPDIKEFQMGINKAEEAIDNCVGDPNSVKLEVKGDLSYFDKPDEKNKKQAKPGYIKPAQKQNNANKREKRNPNKTGTQKTVKQLLGELYADKVYLEKLLEDDNATKQHSKSGDAIWKLANNGLDFLDSRTEFWRQQKPIYARQKKYNRTEKDTPLNYILKQLEVIDSLQSVGKNQESLDKSNRLMNYVNKQSESQLPEKKEITSHVYSNIGNANLEMGKYAQALDAHNKDLEISKEIENKEGISRAHENIGRVYARNGRYKDAIAAWEKKLPMAESDMENAWLYHEIGRCYLELGNYEKARDFGKKSFEFAEKMDDNHWKLNATVLIAQSEAKMNDAENLKSAIKHFEKAIDIAESQEDEAAKKAITKAMEDCKTKLKKVEAGVDVSKEENDKKPAKDSKPIPVASKDKLKTDKSQKDSPKGAKVKYEVEVKTCDEMGAGTDGDVFISLIGDKASENEVLLTGSRSKKNQFEKGSVDKFDLDLKNIGKLSKIVLEQRGGKSGTWKVEHVRVAYNKEIYIFELNKWLDPETGTTKLELTPTKVEDNNTKYEIEIQTGNDSGAGTDSNVTIVVHGADKSVELPLKAHDAISGNKDLFEAGQLDVFHIYGKDIGTLKKISVNSDGKGTGASWKLNTVKIVHNTKTYTFTVNDWIKKNSIDVTPDVAAAPVPPKKDESEAKPAKETKPAPVAASKDNKPKTDNADKDKAAQSKEAPASAKVKYEVEIKTCDEMGAGTDGEVFISLIGDKATENEVLLTGSRSKKNQFEKGSVDKFDLELKNIGKLTKIVVEQRGGKSGAWKVEHIKVSYNKDIYIFELNKWFDPDTDTLKMEFKPTRVEDNNTKYEIEIQTGNDSGAGTDSNITIVVHGADKSVSLPLKTYDTISGNKNLFEGGQLDVFHIYGKDIGTLKRITVESDGKGAGASWKLNTIKITHNTKKYTFTVNEWLKKNTLELTPDGPNGPVPPKREDSPNINEAEERERVEAVAKLEKEKAEKERQQKADKEKAEKERADKEKAEKEKADREKAEKDKADREKAEKEKAERDRKEKYEIHVKTCDEIGAGTDGEVFISLHGDKGDELDVPLNASDSKKNLFERGKVDRFEKELKNIGKLSKITMEQRGGKSGAWKLDYVKVIYKGQIFMFDTDKWLDPDTKTNKVELTPTSFEEGFEKYEIEVKTSADTGAGTDSGISMTLFGNQNLDLALTIKDSVTDVKDLFETGQLDKFDFFAKDIGPLKKISIDLDGKGLSADWKIEYIKIAYKKQVYKFTANKWIKKGQLELQPDGESSSTSPTGNKKK